MVSKRPEMPDQKFYRSFVFKTKWQPDWIYTSPNYVNAKKKQQKNKKQQTLPLLRIELGSSISFFVQLTIAHIHLRS